MATTKKLATTKGAGGRPKDTGLQTKARNRLIAQAEVKPLQVLMDTMTNRWKAAQAATVPKTKARLENEACQVAEKVAPYLHPKLQATTLKGDPSAPLGFVLSLPDSATLKAAIRGKG